MAETPSLSEGGFVQCPFARPPACQPPLGELRRWSPSLCLSRASLSKPTFSAPLLVGSGGRALPICFRPRTWAPVPPQEAAQAAPNLFRHRGGRCSWAAQRAPWRGRIARSASKFCACLLAAPVVVLRASYRPSCNRLNCLTLRLVEVALSMRPAWIFSGPEIVRNISGGHVFMQRRIRRQRLNARLREWPGPLSEHARLIQPCVLRN